MESKQEWISVKDCLPEEGQHILYRARYDGLNTELEQEEIDQAIFNGYTFEWLEDCASKSIGLNKYKITHWLPIPPTNTL